MVVAWMARGGTALDLGVETKWHRGVVGEDR
jgi:hypothetical protein